MANGMYIRRMSPEEPLVTAVERLRPVQSNFISIHQARVEEYLSSESESSEDSDDSDSDVAVYTMTRSGRKIIHPRKELDNGFQPKKRRHVEEFNSPPVKRLAKPKEPTKKTVEEIIPVPKLPTPITVENTQFNPQDDDAFMEDDTRNLEGVQVKPEPKETDTTTVTPWTKKAPRQSEVQSQVDQRNVLGRILSQPVTLAVGEVFGISKEMTASLRDVLKPKPAPKVQIVEIPEGKHPETMEKASIKPLVATAVTETRSKGTLIRLQMEHLYAYKWSVMAVPSPR